jgi:MtN3 and saliva related transmembrane protein
MARGGYYVVGMWVQAVGLLSSLVLLATVGQQVWKQWRDGKSEGVSLWLFVGQTAASLGFVTYSYLLRQWVFLATNALMLANSLLGYGILVRNRRRQRRQPASDGGTPSQLRGRAA